MMNDGNDPCTNDAETDSDVEQEYEAPNNVEENEVKGETASECNFAELRRRKSSLKEIIVNQVMQAQVDLENNASYWNICHVFTILMISAVGLSTQMLIPRQNSIIYQSYWLEVNELMAFTALIADVNMVTELFAFIRHDHFMTFSYFVKMYFWILLAWNIPFIACNSFWKYYLHFNTPMPLSGLLFLVAWWATLFGIWFFFPLETQEDNEVKGKLKTYVFYSLWWNVMAVQKDLLTIIFNHISGNLQWLCAFLIPFLRSGNKCVLSMLVQKMSGNDETANVVLGININVHYAFLIAVRFAGAETETIMSIVVVDFLIHLVFSCQIIQLHQKGGYFRSRKRKI